MSSNNWQDNGSNVYITGGDVGIGTSTPAARMRSGISPSTLSPRDTAS